MEEALPIYQNLIERAGAQIVGVALDENKPGFHGDLEAEAIQCFGAVPLIYIEFWTDGACSSEGLSKKKVADAMLAEGWAEETRDLDDPSDIDLYKQGPNSGKWFTLFHAETEAPGFHLLAPPVFLPALTGDEKAIATATSYLATVLQDLTAIRAEIPKILASTAKPLALSSQ